MNDQVQTLHRRLGELNDIGQKTRSTEQQILKSAAERLDIVNGEIQKLSSRVIADEKASQRYESLILERGRLNQVISSSRDHLS